MLRLLVLVTLLSWTYSGAIAEYTLSDPVVYSPVEYGHTSVRCDEYYPCLERDGAPCQKVCFVLGYGLSYGEIDNQQCSKNCKDANTNGGNELHKCLMGCYVIEKLKHSDTIHNPAVYKEKGYNLSVAYLLLIFIHTSENLPAAAVRFLVSVPDKGLVKAVDDKYISLSSPSEESDRVASFDWFVNEHIDCVTPAPDNQWTITDKDRLFLRILDYFWILPAIATVILMIIYCRCFCVKSATEKHDNGYQYMPIKVIGGDLGYTGKPDKVDLSAKLTQWETIDDSDTKKLIE